MRSTTSYTEIRGIMKRHEQGMSAKEISAEMFIVEKSVAHVISVRFPTKKKKAEAA